MCSDQLHYILFHLCVQLSATLHVRMVRVLLMTLAVVQQDMREKDAMKQVYRSFCFARIYVHITLLPKYFKHLNSAGNSPFIVLMIVCKIADQNNFILPTPLPSPSFYTGM